MSPVRVAPPAGPAEWDGYMRVSSGAFGSTMAETRDWFAGSRGGDRIALVASEGGRVVGGALAYLVPQRFGGRDVPAGAVGDVCVAAERRGRGVARTLLRRLDRAMRDAGAVVSPLWPSTLRLYRREGWEVAGAALRWSLPPVRLEALRGAGEAVADPGPRFRAAHAPTIEGYDGPLVRPEWWWRWLWPDAAREGVRRIGWIEDGRPTGLMRTRRIGSGDALGPLKVEELWAATPDALRGLLGLLGTESTQTDEVVFGLATLPPAPDLLWVLPELPIRASAPETWMLRLLDAAAALDARGWPGRAEARVELEIHDPMAERPLRLVLEVGAGEGRVSPGGAGRVRIGAGALAAWYAGSLSATRAARAGLAEGPPADLLALDGLTGDRPVWLSEDF